MRLRALSYLSLLLGVGCTKPATTGHRVHCNCHYLSDYDDTIHIVVNLCLPDDADLSKASIYCAEQAAHNHIEACDCPTPITASDRCNPSAPDACTTR